VLRAAPVATAGLAAFGRLQTRSADRRADEMSAAISHARRLLAAAEQLGRSSAWWGA